MARRRLGSRSSRPRRFGSVAGRAGVAGRATALAALLILAGALAVFVPYLLRKRTFTAGVPAPPPLYTVAEYALAPGQRACMASVAVEPGARVATFAARPAAVAPSSSSPASSPPSSGPSSATASAAAPRPPVELTLRARGYAASALAPGGRGYRQLSVAIDPPSHAVLASACFVDRGSAPVALDGSNEARTVSRSAMTVAGAPVVGDVALAFTERPRRSLLSELHVLFARASALTDGLVPVWLIWTLAALVALGVPVATLLALHSSLRQDERAASA